MYTGIVAGCFPVVRVETLTGLTRLAVALPAALREDLALGASVGVEGVCLSVTALEGDLVWFDAMQETLMRTTLGALQPGMKVNVERSAKGQAEIGGHVVSGHVDGLAEVVAIERPENNHVIRVRVPEPQRPYVFNKGFVALSGCSLTVSNLDVARGEFEVWLIPETLRRTTFAERQVGDVLNLEVDRQTQVIVDTVTRFLREHGGRFLP
jgi:riboflavin synthase